LIEISDTHTHTHIVLAATFHINLGKAVAPTQFSSVDKFPPRAV